MPSPEEVFPLLAENAATDPDAAHLLKMLARVDETLGERSATPTESSKLRASNRDVAAEVGYEIASEKLSGPRDASRPEGAKADGGMISRYTRVSR